MPRENKSRYAVMGILSLGPMSGYEIRKTIETSLGNFWSESYGQIYPILRSLVSEGLATRHTEVQVGKPNRHVYTLTNAGREELERWLDGPVEHDVGRVELLLKLFFGWQLPIEASARKVRDHNDLQQELLLRYEGIERWLRTEQVDHPGLPYWLMTLSYGRHVARAILAWCEETEGALRELEATHEGAASAPVDRSLDREPVS
ncbi:MAG: PadR family transcriptional regulator [Chloroflexota bacterium]|nr:PadR family transcriptional regulator [Chloroflexota bacterium]